MTDSRCDEFSQLAPEVALGLLAGDERARALSHLAGCPACRDHLEGLLRVSDALLLLAPPGEPAIGFESRVMERLTAEGAFKTAHEAAPASAGRGGRTGARRRRGRLPSAALAMVAAALIVLAAVVGQVAGRASGQRSARHLQASAARQLAARTVVVWADGGRSTCQLVAFAAEGSQPARLVVHLAEPGDPVGSYQVLAEPADGGPAVALGTINVNDGQGLFIVSVPAGTGPVHAIRVLDSARGMKYRATFAPI